jgi:hypothetical protein
MSVDINSIVEHHINIKSSGLAGADFQAAMLYVPYPLIPQAFAAQAGSFLRIRKPDELVNEVKNDDQVTNTGFVTDSETYIAATVWLSGIPAMDKLYVYLGRQSGTLTEDLNHAYEQNSWFWTFLLGSQHTASNMNEVALWVDGKPVFFMAQISAESVMEDVRDPNTDTDIVSVLNKKGYRNTATFISNAAASSTNQMSRYAGMALCKWFASVDYNAVNSTITGEYKKLAGIEAENLTTSEIDAQHNKKAMWYGTAELAGQVDVGRVFNSVTHSSHDEFMDSVLDSMVLVNDVQTSIYNVLTTTNTKLPYTPSGFQQALNKLGEVLQKYVDNGYLGEREITTSKGETKISVGFEIHSTANDILHVSDEERSQRKPPMIRYTFYPAGAIHSFTVTGDMF